MANNYDRLVYFVVDICPEPLRAFFIQLAKKDAGSTYTSLNAYLIKRKRDIDQLHNRKIIRTDQKNLIFPSTCNEEDWDVTLLVTLITNLFRKPIWSYLESEMNDIRNTRNTLLHISNTANISDTDFKNHWRLLESAATALARQVFDVTEQASFKTKIDELKKNCLPNLAKCLRVWCGQTAKHINDLQKEINDLKSETRHTNSILHNVTVKKPGPAGNGDKTKRLKAVNDILKGLQANFEVTMGELPKNFNAPAEALDIRRKLREKHHVVVTGSYNSRYFETALAAIKEMGYNIKRCVVMQTSSDWRHIDPDDVDFVLFIDPFGRITFDETKAKGMADIFKSMKHTAEDQNGKGIDILIVTDITILTECKRRHDHDILDEEVKVFEATTEAQPADLTGMPCENLPMINSTFSLRELTDNFLQLHKDPSLSLDSHVLKSARDKFKSKKAIVLTGSNNCQRAAAAAAFTSSYKPSECLLLTKADDVMLIDWQNTCLVIIDEFAGKYRYEENEVYKWYNMFDHLFSAITTGKINIVITCEQNKLKRCMDKISSHPLLEHVVELPDKVTTIKEEDNDQKEESYNRQLGAPGNFISINARNTAANSGSVELANNMPVRSTNSVIPGSSSLPQLHHNSYRKEQEYGSWTALRDSFTPWSQSEARATTSIIKSSTSSFLWHVTNKTTYSIKFEDDLTECSISCCCCLPSGEILLVDSANDRIKKLDINYNVVGVCNFKYNAEDICYIGNNEAAVSSDKTLHFVDVVKTRMTKSVCTDHNGKKMASHGNLLYVLDYSAVFVYDIKGFRNRVLYSHARNVLHGIAVSDNGSKIYITSFNGLITIDNSGNHLYTLTEIHTIYSCICVDNAGHVLVNDNESKSILQVSSDGRHILGVIEKVSRYFLQAICFDRRRSALVFCEQESNHLTVLDMTKQLLD